MAESDGSYYSGGQAATVLTMLTNITSTTAEAAVAAAASAVTVVQTSSERLHLDDPYDETNKRYYSNEMAAISYPKDSFARRSDNNSNCSKSFETTMIALTLPLWTFITLYFLLLLVYYLRRLQYFQVYDKCTPRYAHFRYDFHLVVGRHSSNYNRAEALILDLLDNQSVSLMTIQIPGHTIFNDQQIFMYRHARNNIRCVNFTVYRRHPIKDVKSVRVAHSCSAQDSRVFIYGLDVYDQTNNESKFFPVQSVVKYRGTQWALLTTFEPKPELSFKKMGVDCYDPFGYSAWPTYFETLTILFYIWCASFCFGHLISVDAIVGNVPLHALTVLFIVASTAAVLSAIYLRVIKTHILDLHYDSFWWHLIQQIYAALVIVVSIGFWALSLKEAENCETQTIRWLISTVSCSLILTLLTLFIWIIGNLRRGSTDRALLAETDANLAKTNSKETLPFTVDPAPSFCAVLMPQKAAVGDPIRPGSKAHSGGPTNANANANANANPAAAQKNSRTSGSGNRRRDAAAAAKTTQKTTTDTKTGDDETLETAFGETKSKYMKNKNRNSISQYV